ncbi:MAG: hypothetical protein WBL21_04720 [Salinimicrobium sp.]
MSLLRKINLIKSLIQDYEESFLLSIKEYPSKRRFYHGIVDLKNFQTRFPALPQKLSLSAALNN